MLGKIESTQEQCGRAAAVRPRLVLLNCNYVYMGTLQA